MIYPLANLFGYDNWIFLGILALLLFGKRLPEVGRSLGKGIVEFKKGLHGIEEEFEQAGQPQRPMSNANVARLPSAYKFDPYTGKPLNAEPAAPPPPRFDPYTGKPLAEDATQPPVGTGA